jgi:hypothetical protein
MSNPAERIRLELTQIVAALATQVRGVWSRVSRESISGA